MLRAASKVRDIKIKRDEERERKKERLKQQSEARRTRPTSREEDCNIAKRLLSSFAQVNREKEKERERERARSRVRRVNLSLSNFFLGALSIHTDNKQL